MLFSVDTNVSRDPGASFWWVKRGKWSQLEWLHCCRIPLPACVTSWPHSAC